MTVEISPASMLELENVACGGNKLSGDPVFFKSSVGADAFVIKVLEDGKPIKIALLRVNPDGDFRLFDRSTRYLPGKQQKEVREVVVETEEE